MKTEQLPSKIPEGFTAQGIPIDKSMEAVGVRIGLNLTLIIEGAPNQNAAYPHVILWNTMSGERMKVYLDQHVVPNTPLTGSGSWKPELMSPTSGNWTKV